MCTIESNLLPSLQEVFFFRGFVCHSILSRFLRTVRKATMVIPPFPSTESQPAFMARNHFAKEAKKKRTKKIDLKHPQLTSTPRGSPSPLRTTRPQLHAKGFTTTPKEVPQRTAKDETCKNSRGPKKKGE